jgi:hypothetical protein
MRARLRAATRHLLCGFRVSILFPNGARVKETMASARSSNRLRTIGRQRGERTRASPWRRDFPME